MTVAPVTVAKSGSLLSLTWITAAAARSHQSCPTLCNPIDSSPPGSQPWDCPGKNTGVGCQFLLQCMKVKSESEVTQLCPTPCGPPGLQPTRLLCPWDFPGKSTKVGCHCLLGPGVKPVSPVVEECNPNHLITTEFSVFSFKFLFFYFIFWLWWVSIAMWGLCLVSANGGYSFLWCSGFSLLLLVLLRSTGSKHVAHRLSCSMARGIFPDQGLNLCPLHCKVYP